MVRFGFIARVCVAIVVVVFWAGICSGFPVTVTITATGDNYLYYYNWEKGSWKNLGYPEYGSWKRAASVNMDFESGYDYLVFAVKNKGIGSNGNGSGLLAQIEISNGVQILSDDSWEVFPIATGWDKSQFDVVTYLSYSWDRASWYAYNNGYINPNHLEADGKDSDGISFWYEENNSRPISGISLDAKWIWTKNNFSPNMDKRVLFRIKIAPTQKTPNPIVPEPNTLIVLLIGVGTVMLWRRGGE